MGDAVARALELVGVTPDRVERWIGAPCGCEERKQKLNALSVWAKRVLKGRVDRAKEYLASVMGD